MKRMKKTVASILTAVVALSAFAFTGCSSEEIKENVNKVTNGVIDMFEESGATTETTDKPSVEDYDGTIVQDGESYAMMSAMAFTASTQATTAETETFTPVSCDLVATVEPSDANQNVFWTVEFVDSTNEWATGKAVGDYIEVTEKSVSTGNVICYKPFGAQIKITATSEENADISASCTVDFVKSIKSVSLSYGDTLPINLGGQTDVTWEINPNGVGLGGDKNVVIEYYQDYTLDETYTDFVNFGSPDGVSGFRYRTSDGSDIYDDGSGDLPGGYTQDKFNLYFWGVGAGDSPSQVFGHKDGCCVVNNTDIVLGDWFSKAYHTKTLVLDRTLLNGRFRYLANSDDTYFSFYVSSSDSVDTVLSKVSSIQNSQLWTCRLYIWGDTTGSFTYYDSLINLTGFTNNPVVKSITLGSENLKF